MTPVVVAMTTWNRPDLLKQTLEGWSKVRGAANAVFQFHCEPGCGEVVDMCRAVDFAEHTVTVNPYRLGHEWNMHKSMEAAFRVSDYAVTAVDDYWPAANLLELHAWHRAAYADDPTVLGLTSGRDIPAPAGGFAGIWRCQLIGVLSGFHRDKWEQLAARWGEYAPWGNWWAWVDRCWLQSEPGLDVLFPSVSYAKALDEPDEVNRCFVPDPGPQEYYEVSGWRERARGFTRWYEITG